MVGFVPWVASSLSGHLFLTGSQHLLQCVGVWGLSAWRSRSVSMTPGRSGEACY